MNHTHHRLAVSVWEGRISPVFDVARHLLLCDVRDGQLASREAVTLPGEETGRQVERLVETGATVLVCGAVSSKLETDITARGVRLLAFTAGDVDEVIAAYFILVDTESGEAVPHDNAQDRQAAQGAGIQAATTVARLGAEAVVTGNVGPKAFRALSAAGIRVHACEGVTVEEALRRFKTGALTEIAGATVEGHWA